MALTSRNPNAIPSGSAPAGVNVEIWTIPLDVSAQQITAALAFLSPDERARAATFRNEQAKRNYIVAHAALRRILANHLSLDPAAIPFSTGSYGKPALTATAQGQWEFNLTHSRDLALVAVARGAEVGVDVEPVRPMPDAVPIAERFFSKTESEALRALPETEQSGAFFRLWTRKEALAKATGMGIANSLARFEVTWGEVAEVRAIEGNARLARAWTLHAFEPVPGYVAAVAVRSPGAQLSFQQFQPDAP